MISDINMFNPFVVMLLIQGKMQHILVVAIHNNQIVVSKPKVVTIFEVILPYLLLRCHIICFDVFFNN